tara:strand:+ start:114 stop:710 length:597 start_codon:yes stop_codon:yes gene_type:complete
MERIKIMNTNKEVEFTRLDEAKKSDFDILYPYLIEQHNDLSKRVISFLSNLRGPKLGLKVDRLEHSLQTATRAYKDNASDEEIVCALLHDIGDSLAPDNHGAFAAEILKPFVNEANYNIVKFHPEFQGYFFFDKIGADPNIRDRHKDNEWFDAAHNFCEYWDMPAFDPNFKSKSLEFFSPVIKEVFSKKPTHNGLDII